MGLGVFGGSGVLGVWGLTILGFGLEAGLGVWGQGIDRRVERGEGSLPLRESGVKNKI